MPYIHPMARERAETEPQDVGELNYAITTLIDKWLKNDGVRYGSINAAIGVLECAKLELYRRIAASYENTKIATNGDVYTCQREG